MTQLSKDHPVEPVTITLGRDEVFLYGSDLTHAIVFLKRANAPASVIQTLIELQALMSNALRQNK